MNYCDVKIKYDIKIEPLIKLIFSIKAYQRYHIDYNSELLKIEMIQIRSFY